jgi:hypothetical protein
VVDVPAAAAARPLAQTATTLPQSAVSDKGVNFGVLILLQRTANTASASGTHAFGKALVEALDASDLQAPAFLLTLWEADCAARGIDSKTRAAAAGGDKEAAATIVSKGGRAAPRHKSFLSRARKACKAFPIVTDANAEAFLSIFYGYADRAKAPIAKTAATAEDALKAAAGWMRTAHKRGASVEEITAFIANALNTLTDSED